MKRHSPFWISLSQTFRCCQDFRFCNFAWIYAFFKEEVSVQIVFLSFFINFILSIQFYQMIFTRDAVVMMFKKVAYRYKSFILNFYMRVHIAFQISSWDIFLVCTEGVYSLMKFRPLLHWAPCLSYETFPSSKRF